MIWIQRVFQRNIVACLALAAVLTFAVDHTKVRDQRGRYLLGIFYNEHFKNYKDGVVYFDYLLRQEPGNPQHRDNLAVCTKKLTSP